MVVLLLISAALTVSCGDGGGKGGADLAAPDGSGNAGNSDTVDNGTAGDNTDPGGGRPTTESDNLSPGGPATDADNITQKYLFEVEHMNSAWVAQYHCLYIDWQGRVYSTNRGSPGFQRPQDGVHTRALLDSKYSVDAVLVGTVDNETLARMAALIGPASQGQLTEPENTCCDFGGTDFNAFLFDAETGIYKTVLLRQCGDWSRKNTAPEAAALFEWLKQVRGGAVCCG